jgi:hypothetical protein
MPLMQSGRKSNSFSITFVDKVQVYYLFCSHKQLIDAPRPFLRVSFSQLYDEQEGLLRNTPPVTVD